MNKFITNLTLLPIRFILSYVTPKKSNLILLGSGLGRKFIGNTKYFYLWMLENNKSKYEFYWITTNKELFEQLKRESKPCLYVYSLKGFFYILRSNWLIIEQSTQDIVGSYLLFGRFNVINTWHGTPIKNITLEAQFPTKTFLNVLRTLVFRIEQKSYKYILACSDTVKKTMIEGLKNESVVTIGYPRDDVFFDQHLVKQNWKNTLKLSSFNKIYLYAPTFRDNTTILEPFSKVFLRKLNIYLKNENSILLIKTHPLAGDTLKIDELKSIINITDAVADIQEILVFIDVLIVDYSSLLFDFSLTNRPIIFYPYDYTDYIKKSRTLYYDYFTEMPGPFASNENELFTLIKQQHRWEKEKEYKQQYKRFQKTFFTHVDGKSCKRLYDLIDKSVLES